MKFFGIKVANEIIYYTFAAKLENERKVFTLKIGKLCTGH